MSKKLKLFWFIKLIEADDPLFVIISSFNNFNITPDIAYCIITLYMRLCKKHIIKSGDKKILKTFENRVLDAEEIISHDQHAAQLFYNKYLFDWEKDLNIFPKRHY